MKDGLVCSGCDDGLGCDVVSGGPVDDDRNSC